MIPTKCADTKDTNAKDGAAGADGRLDMTLVPMTFTAAVAVALTEGDLKYWAYNWRVKGVSARVYVAAMLRHLFKWFSGEHADRKTGVPHLWSVGACLAIMIDAQAIGKFIDDRPPRAPMDDWLEKCRNHVLHLREVYRHAERPKDGPYHSGRNAQSLHDLVAEQRASYTAPIKAGGLSLHETFEAKATRNLK